MNNMSGEGISQWDVNLEGVAVTSAETNFHSQTSQFTKIQHTVDKHFIAVSVTVFRLNTVSIDYKARGS